MRQVVFSLFMCFVSAPLALGQSSKLDPNLPYQAVKSDAVTYKVDFSAVVTAPYHTKTLKVWLPIPQSDEGQEMIGESVLTAFPMNVKPRIGTESRYGNKFAYFEFDHPEGAQIIRHQFTIKVWELNWNIAADKMVRVERWPSGFDKYLQSDKAVVVDDRFMSQAKAIVPEKKNAADDLGAVMDWLSANMKYDHANASLKASAEHALLKKTGHCSDYHGLCASFGRALGYPTRVCYGINPFPKYSPSHCKIEAYLPPYGWVTFDVSDTQKQIAAIKKAKELSAEDKQAFAAAATKRLRSGFRDNTWFMQTKGTEYDLVPPAQQRANVVRTIYAEADGVALAEPDPADETKREFSWMTVHRYEADRVVAYPFKGWEPLKKFR